MTEPHRAVIARLLTDFAAISTQLARVSTDLTELDRLLSESPQAAAHSPAPPAPQYQPPTYQAPQYWPQYHAQYAQPQYAPAAQYPPQTSPPPVAAAVPAVRKPRGEGWIGKLLAVAGVAVTLIGVVLLLVLAAQAGILRPEFRVAAGAVLAVALVGAATRLSARPGGRVGAIALAATGIAAAYIDVIAVTTIYDWVSAPVGLVIAAVVAGAGLTLARRWDSEHLGLLVLVPLIVLAPVVVGGITLLLVGFMLALAAASLPVQFGKDWVWLHAARTAATAAPLLVALVAVYFDDRHDAWLVGACGIAAVLAITGALILLPRTRNRVAIALMTGAGVLPVLSAGLAVDRVIAALMAAALASALLGIVSIGDRLPGVDGAVRRVWAALSAVSAVIAVLVAFNGEVAAPLLLAMAAVVAIGGRREPVARCVAIGFAVIGAVVYLAYASPSTLVEATETSVPDAVSILIASLLLIGCAVAIVWSFPHREPAAWAGAAAVSIYAVTAFTVTVGVLIGGEGAGFFAGHVAATICWIAMAAALFGYAARVARTERSVPIGGGLALVAAAMAKLFLFDLGTLDGIFRVVVFIVVGLVLLGMGAGYARLLEKQDQQNAPADVTATTP
ncbi:DUF2339 domain-containing protein [Mycobacterium deserti]|uniref:DUF2339 domain-containing protein n=1 Tax=Mycobacterium deserti TaxID=2978347 RepID=A0ABT2MCC6_9MYCO|nr:DUF2339 domain-containing protein [Mycobacterium deserti]MCT7659917.1 DUF2339 domain-containing protein [Mycobacterium deserti]